MNGDAADVIRHGPTSASVHPVLPWQQLWLSALEVLCAEEEPTRPRTVVQDREKQDGAVEKP